MSLQSANGGIREAYRAQSAFFAAELELKRTALADWPARLDAQSEYEKWDGYKRVHLAIALQGSMLLINTIDLALKQYSRAQHGQDKWLRAGPKYTPAGRVPLEVRTAPGAVTLLELIRALGNYFRHRDEWLTGQTSASTKKLLAAGLNPVSETTFADALTLMGYGEWLELEADLRAAVATLP